MTEQLYDGPYDGLEVEGAVSGCVIQGVQYDRRMDGRLYKRGSKWDLLPRPHDRL